MSDVAMLESPAGQRGSLAIMVNDSLAMIGRCVRLSRRNVEVLLTSLMLPVILMLLFVYLFGGAMNTGGPYVSYVVPGGLVLSPGSARRAPRWRSARTCTAGSSTGSGRWT